MLLQDVLYKVKIRSVTGNTGIEITDVQLDSRKIKKGSAFIAISGTGTDGHEFIEKAISNGAIAIICEVLPSSKNASVVYVEVENSAAAAGYMTHNFF